MANKVIMVGWDGATFDVINPLIQDGRLPFLKKIIDQGSSGVLMSVIPANSAPAWSSFSTGMNPGKHGVYYFTERLPGSYRMGFTHSVTRTGKPLWMMVSDSGRNVGVINIPGTFPPDCVNGFMISGLDTPTTGYSFTWPENIYEELKQNVGGYAIEPEEARAVELKNDRDRHQFFEALRDNIELRWKCSKYLCRKFSPELLILVFTATDRIQHRFWKYRDPNHPHYDKKSAELFRDAIPTIYSDLDRILGEVVGTMDNETTLFIISDHGMGIRSDKTIYVNRWLLYKGYLNLNVAGNVSDRIKGRIIDFIKKPLRIVKKAMSVSQRKWLRQYFHSLFKHGYFLLETMNIDWASTKAYSNELMNAIWINLEGREPLGMVKPGQQYEMLCEEIAQGLRELRDPETGEPIVKTIYKRDEIYHGSEISKAPDLVIEWNNYTTQTSSLSTREEAARFLSKLTPDQTSRAAMSQTSGEHMPNGILVAYGHGIKKKNRVEGANIIDMAPTILYTLGEKIPQDMDGKILKHIFTDDFLMANEAKFSSTEEQKSYRPRETDIAPEDEEELKERLKALGYL